jgi:hypothetical protein
VARLMLLGLAKARKHHANFSFVRHSCAMHHHLAGPFESSNIMISDTRCVDGLIAVICASPDRQIKHGGFG